MLKYKIDVLEELKGKGYTSYKLRKDKIMGEAQIQKIRQGEIASKETLNTICKLLQIQPGDLLEYIDDYSFNKYTYLKCIICTVFKSIFCLFRQLICTRLKCII